MIFNFSLLQYYDKPKQTNKTVFTSFERLFIVIGSRNYSLIRLNSWSKNGTTQLNNLTLTMASITKQSIFNKYKKILYYLYTDELLLFKNKYILRNNNSYNFFVENVKNYLLTDFSLWTKYFSKPLKWKQKLWLHSWSTALSTTFPSITYLQHVNVVKTKIIYAALT